MSYLHCQDFWKLRVTIPFITCLSTRVICIHMQVPGKTLVCITISSHIHNHIHNHISVSHLPTDNISKTFMFISSYVTHAVLEKMSLWPKVCCFSWMLYKKMLLWAGYKCWFVITSKIYLSPRELYTALGNTRNHLRASPYISTVRIR